jgi:hypothetical protein
MTKKNEPLLPGIATQQTARNLIRLYARLKGEVQKATDGEDTFMWANEAKAYMRHISRLMVLLGIDWHPGDIRPVKTRVQSGPLPWSKLRPRILAVLRAIYLTIGAIFVAQATGIDLSIYQQLVILGVLMLTSKGSAGVAGAGFVTLAATLGSIPAIPVAGLVLLLGVDRFLNEARAITNLVGNGLATIAVAKWEGAFDADRWNAVTGDTATGSRISEKWAAKRLEAIESDDEEVGMPEPAASRAA